MTAPPSNNDEHRLPAPLPDGRRPRALQTQPTVDEPPQQGLSPTFFIWVFHQWWKLVLPAGLVLSVVAGIVVFYLYVPTFESSALILIEDQAPYIAFEVSRHDTVERYLQTQIELLRSEIVLGPVLGRPEVASLDELSGATDGMKHLQKNLTINQVGKSELYVVKYASPSPQAAADVANAVVAEYLDHQTSEDTLRSQRVIVLLDAERRARFDEVDRLRTRVTDLAKEVTGRDPFGHNSVIEADTALSPLSSLYQSMTEVAVEREVLKAEIQALRDSPTLKSEHAGVSGQLELDVHNHPEVRERQLGIDGIAAEMETIKTSGVRIDLKKSPYYRRLERQLKSGTSALDAFKQRLREEMATQLVDAGRLQNQEKIARLAAELSKLDTRAKLFGEKYREHLEAIKDGGAKSVEFEFARSELARKEGVLERIEARKLALQTELRAPARVHLRQKARLPLVPIEPVPYKLLFLACAASLVLPFGLAVAREVMVRRVTNIEQLYQESKVRVLGEITRFPLRRLTANTRALSRVRQDMTVFAESIDSLRTNLFLSQAGHMTQVLVVSSATSGEGKTTVATSLTASIAGATKQPTLIIDADLRSPDVAHVLGIEEHPGLGDYLAGECELSDAIHPLKNGNTFVMPAGQIKKNPHHLVQMQQVEELLDSLRSRFSHIVIDTAPILGASESLVFAKTADAVLYCSLSGVSRSRQVHVAVDRMRHAGCNNIAGSVLSGTSTGRYAQVYGYYPELATMDVS